MKIDNISEKEVFSNLQSTSHKFGISKSGQQFIIDALSNTIYKNPIGTIIREYVSNAHDANVEAGTKQPVIVSLDKDNNGDYFSVVDMGVGLSEERISTVFVNYGESTKRNNDNEIGGFGIGAKSAFSYSDTFFVNTVSEGFVYKYILMKTNQEPEMSLVSKLPNEENLPTGTEIRIYIKDSDLNRFRNEVYNQLRYFDEVFVKDEQSFNEYTIKEFKTFKFSTQAINDSKFNRLHICLGKVNYPIDFSLLGVGSINLPFALKFNIGELKVTLSREELQYDDKTKEVIKQKLKEFQEELIEIYESQKFNFLDVKEFLKHRDINPSIIIDQDSLSFYTYNIKDIVKKQRMKLKQLPFLDDITFPKNPYFFLKCDRKINYTGNFIGIKDNLHINETTLKEAVFLPKGYKKDKMKDLYLSSIGKNYLIEENSKTYYDYCKYLHLKQANYSIKDGMNNTKRIKMYKNIMFQDLMKDLVDYEKIVIPTAFRDKIETEKKRVSSIRKANKLLEPKVETKGIEVYNISDRAGRGFSKITVDFTIRKCTIVLGKKKDTEDMEKLYYKYRAFNDKYWFLCTTNDKIYVELLKLKCVIPIENFEKNFKIGKNCKQRFVGEHVRRFLDKKKIDCRLFPIVKLTLKLGGLESIHYDSLHKDFNVKAKQFFSEELSFELKKLKRFQKLFPYSKEIFDNAFYGIDRKEIFNLENQESNKIIKLRKLLTKHGLYPGKNAYTPICNWEYEFIQENTNKVNYLQSLNK